MAELRTINCEDCGTERQTRRKNTKYCWLCRIYRNVRYAAEFYGQNGTLTCLECEVEFAPLKRGDWLCGHCDYISRRRIEGRCSLCEQQSDRLLNEDVLVCGRCATAPDKRTTFLRAIARKRQARING